ncbi:MAG: YceH family protein [Verrucomicrobiota bacterium]
MEFQLSAEETRVLGCLIEKEMTTPMSYPLTLNALVNACNQKSNRHPVVAYTDSTVQKAMDGLRDKMLAELIFPDGSRVAKYKHQFSYQLGLNAKLQALMCVMMLRGPQTLGELRTRTERMASFDDLKAVAAQIEELITREEGALVMLMPPGPGQKERRYGHLLEGEPALAEAPIGSPTTAAATAPIAGDNRLNELEEEVANLRVELHALRAEFEAYKASFEVAETPTENQA